MRWSKLCVQLQNTDQVFDVLHTCGSHCIWTKEHSNFVDYYYSICLSNLTVKPLLWKKKQLQQCSPGQSFPGKLTRNYLPITVYNFRLNYVPMLYVDYHYSLLSCLKTSRTSYKNCTTYLSSITLNART